MKKEKVSKSEKVLKILKIVGSAIGLTLCSAGFIFLLVVGVRGCAASSNHSNDHEEALQQGQVIERQDINSRYLELNQTYVNSVPLNNKSALIEQFMLLPDLPNPGYGYCDIDFIYQDNKISCSQYYLDMADTYFNIVFDDVSGNNIIEYYASRDNNVFSVYYVISDLFDISYHRLTNPYNGLPLPFELKMVIKYIGQDSLRYRLGFLGFFDTYFQNENTIEEPINLTFNSVINPFGPMGANFDYFCGSERTGRQVLTTGLFKDQTGTYYKSIVLYYISASGTRFGNATEYSVYNGDYLRYMTMSYIDLYDREVSVNAQDFVTATGGSQAGNIVMVKSNHWVSELYRQLEIYYLVPNSNSSGYSSSMDRITALTSLNNISNYTGLNDIGGGSVGSTSLFSLIGNAFSVWVGIFNTQVLPGINLWTLIIIPFLGGIIIFVVWLFKR